MKYVMKSGILYFNDILSAQIKGTFVGPEKEIYSANGALTMRTNIMNLEVPANEISDVCHRQYIIFDKAGNKCAIAKPDYTEADDPTVAGWPICRMPKIDHAQIVIAGKEYLLIMQNNQNYSLYQKTGKIIIQVFHRGLEGGWDIEATNDFAPEMICGIFVFCKYIEQENEFLLA